MSMKKRIAQLEGQLAALVSDQPDGKRRLLDLLDAKAERFRTDPPFESQIAGMPAVDVLALALDGFNSPKLVCRVAHLAKQDTPVGRLFRTLSNQQEAMS